MRLLVEVGTGCAALVDEKMRELPLIEEIPAEGGQHLRALISRRPRWWPT
jgi:hypothetical protein